MLSQLIESFEDHQDRLDLQAQEQLLLLAQKLTVQIKQLREERNWNQSKFAAELGTSQSRVSQVEDPSYGKLTVASLVRIAEVFGKRLDIRFEDRTDNLPLSDHPQFPVDLVEAFSNPPLDDAIVNESRVQQFGYALEGFASDLAEEHPSTYRLPKRLVA